MTQSKSFRIATIPGDGIGMEVISGLTNDKERRTGRLDLVLVGEFDIFSNVVGPIGPCSGAVEVRAPDSKLFPHSQCFQLEAK